MRVGQVASQKGFRLPVTTIAERIVYHPRGTSRPFGWGEAILDLELTHGGLPVLLFALVQAGAVRFTA